MCLACGIYPLNSTEIPEESYRPSIVHGTQESSCEVNTPSTADATATEPNEQTIPSQPAPEENEQITSSDQLIDVVLASAGNADVSLISSIETSDLLQMEEMDISAISISFDETDVEPRQNINPGDDSRPSEQPCTPDLTISAIEFELSLRPEKLDEYRRKYANTITSLMTLSI